jgi:hypothetical protein
VPDVDGLTVLWGTDAFGRWHHVLTHGLLAAVVTALVVFGVARERRLSALLAVAAFHLHLALDLAGSGAGWTISYLYPFSTRELSVGWGWELASWQNVAATVVFITWSLRCAVTSNRSFVEAWMPAAVDATFCALVARTWARVRPRTRAADGH